MAGSSYQACANYSGGDPVYNFHGGRDVFISKFDQHGNLLWMKFYGGSAEEYPWQIKYFNNNLYLVGVTNSSDSSMNFGNSSLGFADGFISKINLDGAVVWSKYFGGPGSEQIYGIDLRNDNEMYIMGTTTSVTDFATPNTFQTVNINFETGKSGFVARLDGNGDKVWATYYGEHKFNWIRSISVGASGVYIMGNDFNQADTGYFATPGSHKEFKGTSLDHFLAKFSFEGKRTWGTYFGGPGTEGNISLGMMTSFEDNIYFCGYSRSETEISTAGSTQENIGGFGSMFLGKMDSTGLLDWCTYAGIQDPAIGTSTISTNVNVDSLGNIYLSGISNLFGLATPGSYKENITLGDHDAFVTKYNSDGQILWGTYFGGENLDGGSRVLLGENSFGIAGYSYSENIATPNSFQGMFNQNVTTGNNFIARFVIPELGLNQSKSKIFTIWPNPAYDVLHLNSTEEIKDINAYDVVGKLIKVNFSLMSNNSAELNVQDLSSGAYFLRIETDKNYYTEKFIKR